MSDKKEFTHRYDAEECRNLQRMIDFAQLTPEQKAAEVEHQAYLDKVKIAIGMKAPVSEKYLLLSEVCEMFGMKPKAIKGFCVRHAVPTIQEPRKFRIAILSFLTAYAQDTNVRTDQALRKRVRRALEQQDIMARLDDATRRLFGQ